MECANEEESEVVEHFGEEIPEYPHIWRQLWHRQDESIHRLEMFPVSHDVVGDQLETDGADDECCQDQQDTLKFRLHLVV